MRPGEQLNRSVLRGHLTNDRAERVEVNLKTGDNRQPSVPRPVTLPAHRRSVPLGVTWPALRLCPNTDRPTSARLALRSLV